MRRIFLLVLIGTVLGVNSSYGSVRGDSVPTPTPGPTAAPTSIGKPAGSHILDAMMRAWLSAGSEHFTWNYRSVNSTGKITTILGGPQKGDVDWHHNPPIFQMQGPTYETKKTAAGQSTSRENEIQLFDQNLLAVKLGQDKWSCDHFFSYDSLPGSPYSESTSAYGLDAHNLGITRVNGAPAWHVQVREIEPGFKGSKHPSSLTVRDYYVATTSNLPLKIRVQSKYWNTTEHGRTDSTLLLRNFGEMVHVTLPPICNGR